MMLSSNKKFLSLIVSLISIPGVAGELTLKNGDVLHGELQSVNDASIVWSSDMLGDLEIAKSRVEHFSTATVLPVVKNTDGVAENCTLSFGDSTREPLQSECAEGELALSTLADITSYAKNPGAFELKGSAQLGYNQKKGNSNSTDLDLRAGLNWQYQLYRHDLDIQAKSDKSEGALTDEKYNVDYQLNYDFSDHWLSYGNAGYKKDRFDSIDEQYELGGGLGYRTVFSNKLQSQAELGFVYLSSKRSDGDTENDIAGKWALKIDWPVPNSKITLFHRHQLLWPIDELENNQLETSTGAKLPLIGGIFSELRYDFDYTAEVTDNQKHADQEWVVSLGYSW